jgi:hypothetical protein
MFERFTQDARQVVFEARSLAIARGDDRIGPLHLLSALTTVSSGGADVAARVLAGAGVDSAAVGRLLGPGPASARHSGTAPESGTRPESGTAPESGTRPQDDTAPDSDTVPDSDAVALASIGIDLDEIKRKVEESFGEGALDRVADRVAAGGAASRGLRGHAALTDDAKSALALSLKEALALHHNYIGTEHLLLGVLRSADSPRRRGRAGSGLRQALDTLGLSYPAVKDQVLALLATT